MTCRVMSDPGRRDRRITVQQLKAAAADDHGHVDQTLAANWETYTTARAEVMTRGGREFFRADVLNAETSTVFRIPYSATTKAVTPDMRIQLDGITYGIVSVQDIDNAHVLIQIEARVNERERLAG